MKHFDIEELVSPVLLKKLSEDACWLLIPSSVQLALDALRDDFGAPIYINGPYKGNIYKNSGVRALDCGMGATYSKHKITSKEMAFDLKCDNMDSLIELVKKNHKKYGISRIENPEITLNWLHAEFSFKPVLSDLKIFNP